MAIDIDSLIADALLRLCQQKHLKKITIADIQKESGVSRQTFYNHFSDKFDLIRYIYETRVISLWKSPNDENLDYYEATLSCLRSDAQYHRFLKQALSLTSMGSFSDFMYEHSRRFDRAWHQFIYGPEAMTDEMLFASDYHSGAKMRMRINWIVEDMPVSPEELLKNCLRMRLIGLNDLLFGAVDRGPYMEAAGRIPAVQADFISQQRTEGGPAWQST